MDKPKLLIVDDDEGIRTQMKWALAQEYDVFIAEDRQSALAVFHAHRPAVVTLDLGLPPHPRDMEEGFRTLIDILQEDTDAKVIVITGGDGKYAHKIGQRACSFVIVQLEGESDPHAVHVLADRTSGVSTTLYGQAEEM
jgi:DNA-binding NtrC family response regulator